MHSTAQAERHVQLAVPRAVTQNPARPECEENVRLEETYVGRAGERENVGERKKDVPSCTPQNFRSLTSLSQAVLARLRRRREASSSRYISAYTEILWQRGRSRAVRAFAELYSRSQEWCFL